MNEAGSRRQAAGSPSSSLPAACCPLPAIPRPLASLQRIWDYKHADHHDAEHLGGDLLGFYKAAVKNRQGKLATLAAAWETLIPEFLAEHCALETFTKGTLTVIVDSSSHLYELRQLLLCGLQSQLILAAKSAHLRKITLKPGRWYDQTDDAKIPKF